MAALTSTYLTPKGKKQQLFWRSPLSPGASRHRPSPHLEAPSAGDNDVLPLDRYSTPKSTLAVTNCYLQHLAPPRSTLSLLGDSTVSCASLKHTATPPLSFTESETESMELSSSYPWGYQE